MNVKKYKIYPEFKQYVEESGIGDDKDTLKKIGKFMLLDTCRFEDARADIEKKLEENWQHSFMTREEAEIAKFKALQCQLMINYAASIAFTIDQYLKDQEKPHKK